MKFRGKLVDIGCIQNLTRTIATISRLVKNCVLRITTDKLFFIVTEKAANGMISIWCELVQGHFFDEYLMEGLSAEDNEIYLELIPENLLKAFKSVQNAKSIKLKLTKKKMPCLTVEAELPSLTAQSRKVIHDMPVAVIPQRLWEDFLEPELPEFDVSIYMPAIKVLRSVIDRMKNLSNYVTVSANQNGEITLKVETDLVNVSTHFKNLLSPSHAKTHHSQGDSQPRDIEEFADARVDIRKLAQFFCGLQINTSKMICNIIHDKALQIFVLDDEVTLQYFLPAVSL